MGFFSLRHRVQTGSGTHPAFYSMSAGPVTLGVKRPRREIDHSPPTSVEVDTWSYTSIPSIRLHGVVLN